MAIKLPTKLEYTDACIAPQHPNRVYSFVRKAMFCFCRCETYVRLVSIICELILYILSVCLFDFFSRFVPFTRHAHFIVSIPQTEWNTLKYAQHCFMCKFHPKNRKVPHIMRIHKAYTQTNNGTRESVKISFAQ